MLAEQRSVSYSLAANVAVETLRTTNAAGVAPLILTGNNLANTVIGNAGNNIVNGGAGADRLQGGAGNDLYVVDSTLDVVIETAGQGTDNVSASLTYTLGASAAVETLRTINAAATTAINLTGNAFNNFMTGNAGANQINGGSGNDRLTGNAGSDFFLFSTAPNATTNRDTIVDFNVAQDTVRLENAVFTAIGAATGVLAANKFFKGAAAHDADDRIVPYDRARALIYDTNGKAAGGAVQFGTMAKNLLMTNADFWVV